MRGLYVITDEKLTPASTLLAQVEAALAGGARIIQYRDKSSSSAKRQQQASELLDLCHQYNACFIVNDDAPLAAKIKAHGVHLGLTDSPLAEARALLGEGAIIGATCHGDIENAYRAVDAGADYVAFGRFFLSSTKPDAAPAELDKIAPRLATLPLPAAAIGGITISNAPQLRAAGFAMLAVVADIFTQQDITAHCQRYAALFHD
ncbi:MAG: thiamine phosphate synthase [Gammaproteobacteria bacterium]|nr:MAG: thiamine phosphate synthase [Gammaproteobacteria bacterium]